MNADVSNTKDVRGKHTPLHYATVLIIVAVYWLLFAWANDMVVFYRQSIYPLLSATSTPNPYFVIYTDSPLAFYNSGVQWAPTGHLLLVFLFGNTFFSVLLSLLLVVNLNYAYSSISKGQLRNSTGKTVVPIMLFVILMASFSPLAALPLLPLSSNQITLPLQIWVSSYGQFSNLASSIVLLLLLPFWRQLIGKDLVHGAQSSLAD